MTKKTLYILASIYFIITFGFIIFPPIVSMIDKIEPHVLGLPFFQFCLLASCFLMAFGLIAWFLLECGIENNQWEKEDREVESK